MSAVALANRQKGEILVALEVSSLDKLSYQAFHNITLEADDGSSLIDHLIISRFGVFLIETHNYGGLIFGEESQPQWTCELGEIKRKFQNPLRQSYWHIHALSRLLELPENQFYSIIAFCGDAEFRTPIPANVMTSGYSSYIRGKSARLIAEPEVQRLAEKLKGLMLSDGENTHRIRVESPRHEHGKAKTARNVHHLPRAAKTVHSTMSRLLQTLKDRFPKQPKKRAVMLGSAAAAVLATVLVLLSFSTGEESPSAVDKAESASLAAEPNSPASPNEPPSLTQPAGNDSALPKKSEKVLKEEAWQRWYKEPEKCKRITDGNRVECANYYIAAKRRFERLYAAGKVN